MQTVLLLASLALAQSADQRSVVAVFPIQDSSQRLEANALAQLTDYLGVKVAEGGAFYVVPRKDIDAAMGQTKADSYQACYDQACQIEIGKELAAQKILHTQIVQVGDQCAVTATLYDLRIAATEKAASHKAGCTENELVVSLEHVAAKLRSDERDGADEAADPPAASPSPTTTATRDDSPRFGLKLVSDPAGAEVILDGRAAGITPTQLSVSAGESHRVTLQAEGYETHSEVLELDRDTRHEVTLRMTRDHRINRTEWFGLSAAAAVTLGGSVGGGVWVRGVNLHFGNLSWSVVEAYLGALNTDSFNTGCDTEALRTNGFCENTESEVNAFLGTRPGWTFALDEAGEHALEASLGFGLYAIGGGNDEYSGLSLSPSIRYLRRSEGSLVYGAGLRVIVPVSRESCDPATSSSLTPYIRCRHGNPLSIQLEVPFGWYY